ncbi:MAG TPA: FapA family protein [Patescibacteria group bacterium]|nr:FapA family protein [Patescibacteria group bacterium]
MKPLDAFSNLPFVDQNPIREPEIRVKVNPRKLEAYLTVFLPENCRQPTLNDLHQKLASLGICFGLDENSLKQALQRPGIEFPCARGIAPKNGDNAVITYSFCQENRGRPAELEDGRVDFKSLNLFTTVHNNDVLAIKTPPTPGVAGVSVYGSNIPPLPGKDLALLAGKNVRIDEKGLWLLASTDGQVMVERGKISVQPLLTIPGDVDLSTGNIDFIGNVIIHGSVNVGFTVNATGTVDVLGLISGGNVSANQIIVRHGIQGMNKGLVRSNNDVIAQFIENADIRAGRDVIVNNTILHSYVEAYRRVVVKGATGQIIGGKIQAGEEIITYAAGRPRAATTELRAGSIPTLEDEHRRLSWRLLESRHEMEQLSRPLEYYAELNYQTASTHQLQEKTRLQNMQRELSLEIASYRCRIAEINRIIQPPELCRICVAGPAHPGVVIAIGERSQTLDDALHSVTFLADDDVLRSVPYRRETVFI